MEKAAFPAGDFSLVSLRGRRETQANFSPEMKYGSPIDSPPGYSRTEVPNGMFDLILCRNLVFTYFVRELQLKIGDELVGKLHSGGYLVLGSHESVSDALKGLSPARWRLRSYRKLCY